MTPAYSSRRANAVTTGSAPRSLVVANLVTRLAGTGALALPIWNVNAPRVRCPSEAMTWYTAT